jgi:hypothetical protein
LRWSSVRKGVKANTGRWVVLAFQVLVVLFALQFSHHDGRKLLKRNAS